MFIIIAGMQGGLSQSGLPSARHTRCGFPRAIHLLKGPVARWKMLDMAQSVGYNELVDHSGESVCAPRDESSRC